MWSMGCCLYAMSAGRGPFEDSGTALGDVLRKVKSGTFEFPQNISPTFKDLLQRLINMDTEQRYSIDEVLRHPFFQHSSTAGKQRNQSSSQIKQLLDLTPLVKQSHRQTCSMIALEK